MSTQNSHYIQHISDRSRSYQLRMTLNIFYDLNDYKKKIILNEQINHATTTAPATSRYNVLKIKVKSIRDTVKKIVEYLSGL